MAIFWWKASENELEEVHVGFSTNSSENFPVIRCSTKWSRFHWIMLLILGTLALAFFLIHVGFFKGSVTERNDHCNTYNCIATSIKIRSAMDPSTNPCDDFYQFACGNYQKQLNLSSIGYVNVFSELENRVEAQLKSTMEDDSVSKESRVFGLVNKLYRLCMDDKFKELRMVHFDGILRKIGGSPMVDGEQWNETAFDWIESIRIMRDTGLPTNHFFDVAVMPNIKNSSLRSIAVGQPGSLREYFKSEDFDANYAAAPPDVQTLAKHFEYTFPTKQNNGIEFKISELQLKYPYIRWMHYFNALMPADVPIRSDEVVIVRTPAYFDRLVGVLQTTPKSTIANFFAWRSFQYSNRYLYTAENEEEWKYFGWKECVSFVTSKLPPAVGALYIRKSFNQKSAQHAEQLVESIRSSFIDVLKNVTWIDESTKKAVVDKTEAIVAHIAFPQELTNITKLEEHYKSLTFDENEYFLNILRLYEFNVDNKFWPIYDPVNRTHWPKDKMPTEVTATYAPLKNTIMIPAAILQAPFYASDRPNYLNYGGIGQVIGHEITHGFDNLGVQFDKNGNLNDWWMPKAELEFQEKIECIVQQYGNFTDSAIHMNINGRSTRRENIADNSGLKSAYYAYMKWINQNGDEPHLPELKQYTSKQMFWISAAQVWCLRSGDLYKQIVINSDPHSPSRFRVIGSMQNSKEFAVDFKCAPGTLMNPIEKCEIW